MAVKPQFPRGVMHPKAHKLYESDSSVESNGFALKCGVEFMRHRVRVVSARICVKRVWNDVPFCSQGGWHTLGGCSNLEWLASTRECSLNNLRIVGEHL